MEEECETITGVGLGLLQIGPSEESSSDLITTALPLQGSGVGDDWTAARGTATPGVERVGEGTLVAKARRAGERCPRPWKSREDEQGYQSV